MYNLSEEQVRRVVGLLRSLEAVKDSPCDDAVELDVGADMRRLMKASAQGIHSGRVLMAMEVAGELSDIFCDEVREYRKFERQDIRQQFFDSHYEEAKKRGMSDDDAMMFAEAEWEKCREAVDMNQDIYPGGVA